MELDGVTALEILKQTRQLIVARFDRTGRFLEGNLGFCEYFHSLLVDGVQWGDLFMGELPCLETVTSDIPIEGETFMLCSRLGGIISSSVRCSGDEFLYCGEVMDVQDKQLIEEISQLSNEMNHLMSQLRKERQQLQIANKKIADISRRDTLTGVYNRRAFLELASPKISFCHRHDIDISLLFMDLDHFKSVNDTWGHQVGDALLTSFTSAVSGTIREEDIFARFGGEEFVLLLPSQDEVGASVVANRVVSLCREIELDGVDRRHTVSVGVAQLEKESTLDELLKNSDSACYYSKEHGRDRVSLASHLLYTNE